MNRLIHYIYFGIVLTAMIVVAGCGGRRVDAAPGIAPDVAPVARPFDAAELIARLRAERGRTPKTLRAKSKAVVESPDLDGKKRALTVTLIAQPPSSLRFRAEGFGPIGELFQLIQIGPLMIVYLSDQGELFVGPVGDLDESAGLVRRLQPMRLLRALTIYDFLLEHASRGTWSRIDAAYVALDAPIDLEGMQNAQFVLNRETLDLVRVTLHPVAPADPSEPILPIVITYDGWRVENGIALPEEAIVSIPSEHTAIALEGIDYRIDPKLPSAAFKAPRTKKVYPLCYLVFVAPEPPDEPSAP